MERIDALKKLLALVEAGESSGKRIWFSQYFVYCDRLGRDYHGVWAEKAYGGSLDAAKELHDAVLPGWDGRVYMSGDVWLYIPTLGKPPKLEVTHYSTFPPARAWLCAIIKALIAQEES